MDTKNTFPNGFISEEIYMKPTPGLFHLSEHVCHLCHALYCLKPPLQARFSRFSNAIHSIGFTQNHYDLWLCTILVRADRPRQCVVLLLYDNDMIVTKNDHRKVKITCWRNFCAHNLIWTISASFPISSALKSLLHPADYYLHNRNIFATLFLTPK